MKKCPYCAEQIQDEAILCRYCGRDLPATPVGASEAESPLSQIESGYDQLLSALRDASPEDRHRYPLSADRRSPVVARIVAQIENVSPELNFTHVLSHYIWWHSAADKKSKPPYIWQEEAQRVLNASVTDPLFPTEEEWLSAVAVVLVRAGKGGYAPKLFAFDWLQAWQGIQKAKRADRIIRGFTVFGALANVASRYLPKKLPKEGSFEWHACRRAYAQIEAMVANELTSRSS